jgi:hypothetical protein
MIASASEYRWENFIAGGCGFSLAPFRGLHLTIAKQETECFPLSFWLAWL